MSLISLDQAKSLLLEDLPALATDEVALEDLLGRTLAEPVIASHSQPAEPRATMDGIAVPDAKPAVGTSWRLVGDVPAGGRPSAPLLPGQAIRTATGAAVPVGTTLVLPQEILKFSGNEVSLNSDAGENPFLRRTGADFEEGESLLERGVRIGPAELGLVAAANCVSASAMRKPRIAILAAGDELVAPGSTLESGRSVDSASYAIAALIRRWGGAPQRLPLLRDDIGPIVFALETAVEENDIVICIGGASVGARDLMRPAARAIDARLLFEGIAVQPGKPCWHARLGTEKLILGLPGNPSSALVCAHLLLLPLMERLLGRTGERCFRPSHVTTALPANGSREQYLRAAASFDGETGLLATPLADQDSGLQANLARAQLLIRRPARAGPLEAGARVDVLELTRD